MREDAKRDRAELVASREAERRALTDEATVLRASAESAANAASRAEAARDAWEPRFDFVEPITGEDRRERGVQK